VPGEHRLPIDPALDNVSWRGQFGTTPAFPFVHAFAPLEPASLAAPRQAALRTFDLYWKLLHAVGIERSDDERQTRPYNLLATREWILVVPRSQEAYAASAAEGINVHALGYAGSLMVWDEEGLRVVREQGPLAILTAVGVPLSESATGA